jgi:hypothetical protein
VRSSSLAGYSAAGFLVAVLVFLAGLAGGFVQLLAAVAGGFLALLLLGFFEVDYGWQGAAIVVAIASMAGAAVSFATGGEAWVIAAGPILAAVAAGGTVWVRTQSSTSKCPLCGGPMRAEVSFDCPRCNLHVCDGCWRFESLRCRLCDDNKVPVFPADPRWWRDLFGDAVNRGRCQLCLAEPDKERLYACPRCSRPQCRSCWDHSNGRCQRCGWIIEDLPPALASYVAGQRRTE